MGNPANHHELCPRHRWYRSTYVTCQCALIRQVEAREQERHGNNCGGLWDEWLTGLRAAVASLPDRGLEIPHDTGEVHDLVWRDDVLALLDEDES